MVWGLPRCVWARESTAPAQGNQSLSRELRPLSSGGRAVLEPHDPGPHSSLLTPARPPNTANTRPATAWPGIDGSPPGSPVPGILQIRTLEWVHADGQLQTVSINDKPLWRYSYDLNGNLHLLSPGNSARLTPLRYDLRDRITRLGDVQYKMDEDGFLRQRGSDIFEYNSAGLLIKAYNRGGGWSVRYRYDGLGRRVSSKSSQSHHLQFFYADLTNPTKVTHLYNHSSSATS